MGISSINKKFYQKNITEFGKYIPVSKGFTQTSCFGSSVRKLGPTKCSLICLKIALEL